MKNYLSILLFITLSFNFNAQGPKGFNYQATVRNASGDLILNQNVNFKFNILQGSQTAEPSYTETHDVQTDDLGQVSLVIGKGTPSNGVFSDLDWSLGDYFLDIELNTGGGYIAMGTTQFYSVPYALYAEKTNAVKESQTLADVVALGNEVNGQIKNLSEPTDFKDAATKIYVDKLNEKIETLNSKLEFYDKKLGVLTYKRSLPKTNLEKYIVYENYSEINTSTGLVNPNFYNSSLNNGNERGVNPLYRYSSPMTTTGGFPYQVKQNLPRSLGYMVEFYANTRWIEILGYAGNTRINVIVDDEIVTNKIIFPQTGGVRYFRIDLGTKEKRHIKISTYGFFGGVNVDTDGEVTQYVEDKMTMLVEGDSIIEGSNAGGTSAMWLYSYPGIVSQILNFDLINMAVGGSGFVKIGNQQEPNMLDRLESYVISQKPDIFLVSGGLNDSNQDLSVLKSNIDSYFFKIKTDLPNTYIIVMSPFNPSGSYLNNIETITEYLRLAALKNNLPYIDIIHSKTYDGLGNLLTDNSNGFLGNIITGTGNSDKPSNPIDGNRSYYISGDNTHPTPEGHRYLGLRVSAEVLKILKNN